ncbi:DUF5050 domain-containing protein [Desulfosporosinus shakirovi]|uniref:DUF5050 domain-containing protein n=1 Tax=Desulfosporosinus shakirovi TaxID=2885154 RepID=UPI001E529C0B|nr:DUF5050 domain-containing protein [Desulfosporosinus sp. SRJS8]MCB8818093.1 DUF5050 domain-containing protein [Desulfosporosinus sp. SRJS8]
MDINNNKRNRQIFSIYIMLIFTLIFGAIGCQNSGQGQTASNSNNSGSNTAAPQENDENLQGNIPGNLIRNSYVVEKGDTRYFLSRDGDRSNYLTHTGLYLQSVDDNAAKRLIYDYIRNPQIAGDFVYYLSDKNQLCRVNTKTKEPKQEIIQQGVYLYSLYDHWVYYWNKSDTFLYRLDLSNIQSAPQKMTESKEMDTLIARGDYILAVERNTERSSQNVNSTFQAWKLSLDGTKKDLFLSIPQSEPNLIQPHKDQLYYLQSNIIWCTNSSGKNKKQVYSPENSKITYFIIYDNRIYTEEFTDKDRHTYVSVDLQGKDKRLIFTYRSPIDTNGSTVNGTMDDMTIYNFNVTRDYLFLTGASYYHGEILTTRLPIAGDAEGKKEEVFLNGAWRSIEDYVEEIDRVLVSKGLKQ